MIYDYSDNSDAFTNLNNTLTNFTLFQNMI